MAESVTERGQVFLIEASTAEEAEAQVRPWFKFTPQYDIRIVSNEPAANGFRRLMVEWDAPDDAWRQKPREAIGG